MFKPKSWCIDKEITIKINDLKVANPVRTPPAGDDSKRANSYLANSTDGVFNAARLLLSLSSH